MRLARRVSFSAPFVMVVGSLAACGPAKSPEPLHRNPPPPESGPRPDSAKRSVEECKEIRRDTPCVGDESCDIQPGCGLNGWQCREGKWHEMMKLCNPPPPSDIGGGPGE